MAKIKETDLFTGVKLADYDAAIADGMIEIIGEELIQKFHSDVNQNGEYDDTDNQENQLV